MNATSTIALAAFVFTAGCSSSSGTGAPTYESLYTAPPNATATAGDVHGVWGGSTTLDGIALDYRFEFEHSAVTLANRCKFPDGSTITVGATAAARVTDHDVTMLESKSDDVTQGTNKCNVDIKPNTYGYAIDGLNLTLSASDGSTLTMVKLHD